MSQKLLQAVAQNTRLRVVNLLKKSQGMTVPDIAAELGMSYMGVRDVCLDLEKRGIIDTWREPKQAGQTGRPRRVFRLTGKAHDLFPAASNPLTLDLLEAAKKLFGPAAPEKLLLLVWQQKTASLRARMKGEELRDRAECLARLRDADGHMATVDDADGLRIVERHCPFLDVLRAFPIVAKLDADMVARLLGAPVRRVTEEVSGLLRVDFVVG